MKQLFALALVFCFFSGPLAADTPVKSFEEMTITELQAVDTKALSRDEKKRLKAVLKAKKKAEKARLSEEKKRAKAEAKQQKKARKRLSFIQDTFEGLEVWESHHPTVTNIKGRQAWMGSWPIKEALDSNGGDAGYFLHSYFQPATGLIEPRLHVTIKFTTAVIQKELDQPYATPALYAWEHGFWKGYQFASASNGAPRMVHEGSKHAPNCSYYCTFYEEMDIDLLMSDVETAVTNGHALTILLGSKVSKPLEIIVSYDYLAGYLLRLQEVAPLNSDVTEPLENHVAALKNAAALTSFVD